MPRNPADLYRRLLERCEAALGLEDAAATRSRLYTLLKPARLTDHPELATVLDELDVGAGYARNHLLSLGGTVHTAIGEMQRELEEVGAVLVGYHLGVDERGTEDWHVLVGRV